MKICALTTVALTLMALSCAAFGAEPRLDAPPSAPAPLGIWQMHPGGAVFAIREGADADHFDLEVLDTPDYTVATPCLMGSMEATATPWVYDAAVMASPGRSGSAVRHFMVKVQPEAGRLSFSPYRASHRLSLVRWAGYLFRVTIVAPDRPTGNDGAVRLSPSPGNIVEL